MCCGPYLTQCSGLHAPLSAQVFLKPALLMIIIHLVSEELTRFSGVEQHNYLSQLCIVEPNFSHHLASEGSEAELDLYEVYSLSLCASS